MTSYFEDVQAFHRRFGFPSPDTFLGGLPPEAWALRMRLILEELAETAKAYSIGSLDEFADGLADLVYVVLGTAVETGIPFDAIWSEVQATNMAKLGGSVDAGGKLMKPPGWKAPDIASILRNEGRDSGPALATQVGNLDGGGGSAAPVATEGGLQSAHSAAIPFVPRCDSVHNGVRCLLDPGHPGDHQGTRKGKWNG